MKETVVHLLLEVLPMGVCTFGWGLMIYVYTAYSCQCQSSYTMLSLVHGTIWRSVAVDYDLNVELDRANPLSWVLEANVA